MIKFWQDQDDMTHLENASYADKDDKVMYANAYKYMCGHPLTQTYSAHI